MKTPFLIAIIKIGSSLLALFVAAFAKWLKDRNKRRNIKEGTVKNMKIFIPRERQLYKDNPDEFMAKFHPQEVFFKEELIINAFRPIFILTVISLFAYSNNVFLFFVAGVVIVYGFIEFSLDELKEKKLYPLILLAIWIISFFIVYYSELDVQEKSSCDSTTEVVNNSKVQ